MESMLHYSDDLLIKGIKEDQQEIIHFIYAEYFSLARSIVEKNSGTYEDAEDIFQDGLIVLFKKITSENLSLNCSLKTFIYSICKNIWKQRLDRKWRLLYKEEIVSESIEDYEAIPIEAKEEEIERIRLYQIYFLSLPPDCQKILNLFNLKISLKEIAKYMGFKDVSYAKTRKYLCKNMLRKKIMQDSQYKIFFHHE
jgi:RNA polymerase sigma factor (sigma-70 family)